MTINVGDRVEITQIRSQWGRRLQRMERGARVERMRGRVVWTGPRFAVVELDAGYRESFWYDEFRLVGSGRKSA